MLLLIIDNDGCVAYDADDTGVAYDADDNEAYNDANVDKTRLTLKTEVFNPT